MDRLRILLADDHELIREGLKARIAPHSDLEIVGEASNGRDAVRMAQQLKPDLVIMDVSMPDMNGLKATKAIKKSDPGIKILALTRHGDDGYLKQFLEAGASGFVLKQSASDDLIRAIRAIGAGQSYLDAAMTARLIHHSVTVTTRGTPAEKGLSAREEEVLRMIAWGYANKEIGAQLDLSVKTIEVHKANGMKKLGMSSRIDVVRYALLQGWLRED